jgi:DNA-binding MarR family transcriptional regulator
MNEILTIGDEIYSLAKMLKQETDSRLARLSLGQGQFLLLMYLLKQTPDIPATQEEIALAMGLNKANVSRNVAKLEEKGLLEVFPDPGNARKRPVKLTPRALRMGEEIGGEFREIHKKMTRGIEEKKLTVTAGVLRIMAANMKEQGEKE